MVGTLAQHLAPKTQRYDISCLLPVNGSVGILPGCQQEGTRLCVSIEYAAASAQYEWLRPESLSKVCTSSIVILIARSASPFCADE